MKVVMEDGGYGGRTSTGVLVLKVESVEMVAQMLVVEIIMDILEVREQRVMLVVEEVEGGGGGPPTPT